jgi:dihydrofolate synthase / folylpolyglutamate synthase
VDPLAYLFSLERLGMKFGLEHMRIVCAALDHPERAFESVIIAGTNGKGSVAAMASAALHAAGHRVGRYTSPHLERLEERFVVDESEIDTGALTSVAATVKGTVEELLATGALEEPPTFFEFATAMAFELFCQNRVAIAVLEVGLGGRLDATNVVSPLAAAITSIDFDHQAQLGHTIEEIAREKAGVIKPGVPVVCGPVPAAAEAVIRDVCAQRGAAFIAAPAQVRTEASTSGAVTFMSDRQELRDVRLALAGEHQIQNAAVAVCLLERVEARGIPIGAGAIRSGLESARWPARLEHRTWHGAEVLIDAAHNPAGARALATHLDRIGWTAATLVFGAMRDKDVAGMIAALVPVSARVICVTARSPRAMPAAQIAVLAQSVAGTAIPVTAIDEPEAALHEACRPGARVVVAGSVFLAGPSRGILR